MQARARKAEERKAKKEAEAAAKAKAKASGESTSTVHGLQDATEAAAPDVAADTAAEMDSKGAKEGEEGTLAEAHQGEEDMAVDDGSLAALKAEAEAEAAKAMAGPNTANGDIEMAEVNLFIMVLAPSLSPQAALKIPTQHKSFPPTCMACRGTPSACAGQTGG